MAPTPKATKQCGTITGRARRNNLKISKSGQDTAALISLRRDPSFVRLFLSPFSLHSALRLCPPRPLCFPFDPVHSLRVLREPSSLS